MDNLQRLLILSLFFPFVCNAANNWIPQWVDGPAPATYERTPNYMRTYVDLPKYGGHAQWTLNSTAPNNGAGKFFSGASTATTPKIATNVSVPMGVVAGAAAAATLTATTTKAAMARAGMALVRANPYFATGLTMAWLAKAGYDLYQDEFGQKQIGFVPSAVLPPYYNYDAGGGCIENSANDAAICRINLIFSQNNCNSSSSSYYCPRSVTITNETSSGFNYSTDSGSYPIMSGSKSSTTTCQSGYTFVSGICNRDDPNPVPVPVTDSQIASDLQNTPVSGSVDTAPGLDGVIDEQIKAGFNPDTDLSTPQLTGPSTVQGPQSTTTAPNGDVITNNTTYNNTYTQNYIDSTETTTQTVTLPDNTTETTTTISPTEPPVTPSEPATEQQTDCDKYPDTIGCSKYGDIPEPELIPETAVPIPLNASSWGSGECPADVPLSNHFTSASLIFSFAPVCTFLSSLAPVLIAVAWLSAGFIVFGAIKE